MWEQFEKLRGWLAGRKTFLLSGAAALTALAAFASGTITQAELIHALYEAGAACTIKAGIARTASGASPVSEIKLPPVLVTENTEKLNQ